MLIKLGDDYCARNSRSCFSISKLAQEKVNSSLSLDMKVSVNYWLLLETKSLVVSKIFSWNIVLLECTVKCVRYV